MICDLRYAPDLFYPAPGNIDITKELNIKFTDALLFMVNTSNALLLQMSLRIREYWIKPSTSS